MQSYLNGLRASSISCLESTSGRQWWRDIRERYGELSQFSGFESLLLFFERRDGDRSYFDERDQILRALLEEHRASAEPQRTHDLFLLLYMPLLVRIAAEFGPRAKGRSLDADDTAPEIVHAFLELLGSLNVATNRDIHTSLIRRTRGHFLKWADREFQRTSVTDSTVEEAALSATSLDAVSMASATPGGGWELDISKLVIDELLRRGVIDATVHRLLVGTVVYEKQLKQLVAEPDEHIGYEAAKKRLQRAQKQIRAYLRRTEFELTELANAAAQNFSDSDVPSTQKPGRRPPKAKE